MKSAPLTLTVFITLAAACGAPSSGPEPALADFEVGAKAHARAPAAPSGLAELPAELKCVTAAFRGRGVLEPRVLRLELQRSDDGATATSREGPQFGSHAGTAPAARTSAARKLSLRRRAPRPDGLIVLDAAPPVALRLTLRKDGPVWRGSHGPTGATQKASLALTCWNERALFGADGLQAHFDWSRGVCVDAHGRAALNAIPIEVVRETGYGACADLRGVSLNGDDFMMPNLDGWSLQGAQLAGARLYFASLRGASLQGADLSALEFGYATVTGTIDGHTLLPGGAEGGCTITNSPWAGKTASCAR